MTKETVNRMKVPPTGWKKIFSNHISENGLISKLYKELKQPNSKNMNHLKSELNRYFSKEDIRGLIVA
jgi:hypothetical protein